MKGLIIIFFALTNVIFYNFAQVNLECDKDKLYKPFVEDPLSAIQDYYYICLSENGEAVKKECPEGYKFMQSSLGCSLAPPTTPIGVCKYLGQVISVADDCKSAKLCKDSSGQLAIEDVPCPSTEPVFNKFLGKCVTEAEAEHCDKNNNEKPNCDFSAYANRYLPSLTDCQSLYKCDNGIRVKLTCPTGNSFNPISQICLDAAETPCSTSSSTGVNINTICKGKAKKFVADPNYCKGYYYCVDESTPFWSYCADKKYFNNGLCVTTRSPTCTCEDVDFDSDDAVVYVPQVDKTKFYICKKGELGTLKQCPKGTVFDESEESCV